MSRPWELAPLVVSEIFKTIARLREVSRTTIFLVEQNARAALKLSDRGYVMETGKIMFEADAADLLRTRKCSARIWAKRKNRFGHRGGYYGNLGRKI